MRRVPVLLAGWPLTVSPGQALRRRRAVPFATIVWFARCICIYLQCLCLEHSAVLPSQPSRHSQLDSEVWLGPLLLVDVCTTLE